jgi:hypothetical protein
VDITLLKIGKQVKDGILPCRFGDLSLFFGGPKTHLSAVKSRHRPYLITSVPVLQLPHADANRRKKNLVIVTMTVTVSSYGLCEKNKHHDIKRKKGLHLASQSSI